MYSRSNFSVHWGNGRTSLCPSIALLGQGIPWYPTIQNFANVRLGRDSNPCIQEKEHWRKRRIEMQHLRPLRHRLDHEEQLMDVVLMVLAVCIRMCTLGYTHPYIRPLLHWTGYTAGYKEQWAPKAVSTQWRNRKSWIG